MSVSLPLDAYLQQCRERVNDTLEHLFETTDVASSRLNQACHYAISAGGKRIRPILAYAACELAGGEQAQADTVCAALELLHTYSLVHDDLPAMDDDDLRRGKPTCHKQFDEATAILAGDALHDMAFQLIAEDNALSADTRIQLLTTLSRASGLHGMAAGQMIDIDATGQQLALQQLEQLHQLKTGRLITASVMMGAICANADQALLDKLEAFGDAIGLAFQIHDDVLDVVGDTQTLGKPGGSDIRLGKNTFPALLGLENSEARAQALFQQASELLAPYGPGNKALLDIAHFIITRSH